MQVIDTDIDKQFSKSVYKLVLSNPSVKSDVHQKIIIVKKNEYYQIERYTAEQVFHENMSFELARRLVTSSLGSAYKQCNSWDDTNEYSIRISKKGKWLCTQSAITQAPKKQPTHNRVKNHILQEGTLIKPLVDMGILTEDGKVVNSMYDKFKQINRFVEIIDDEIKKLGQEQLTVIDFGCGKSYLTFILYYYLTQVKQKKVKMIGLDLKKEVIEHCSRTALKYGYDGLSFELGDINSYSCDFPVDIVISLHACDTATDYALFHAIGWNTKLIYCVPCCQHELNSQITGSRLPLITRYGIIKERTAALLTDAVRANLLVYSGYDAQLLEFIELEHTPKNILIRARKAAVTHNARALALNEVKQLIDEFAVKPTLYRLINPDKPSED